MILVRPGHGPEEPDVVKCVHCGALYYRFPSGETIKLVAGAKSN